MVNDRNTYDHIFDLITFQDMEVNYILALSAGAVEYTDCFSADGLYSPIHHRCPGYDTKQSDGDIPAMLEL